MGKYLIGKLVTCIVIPLYSDGPVCNLWNVSGVCCAYKDWQGYAENPARFLEYTDDEFVQSREYTARHMPAFTYTYYYPMLSRAAVSPAHTVFTALCREAGN